MDRVFTKQDLLNIEKNFSFDPELQQTVHKLHESLFPKLYYSVSHEEIAGQYVFGTFGNQVFKTFSITNPLVEKLDKFTELVKKERSAKAIRKSKGIINGLNDMLKHHPDLLYTYFLFSYDIYNNLGIAYYMDGQIEESIKTFYKAMFLEWMFVSLDYFYYNTNDYNSFIDVSTAFQNICNINGLKGIHSDNDIVFQKSSSTNNKNSMFICIDDVIDTIKYFIVENEHTVNNHMLNNLLLYLLTMDEVFAQNKNQESLRGGALTIKKSLNTERTFFDTLDNSIKSAYTYANNNNHKTVSGKAEQAVDYADKGILCKRSGDYEGAIKNYKKAIELSPETGMYYYNLGKTLYLTERYEEAKRAYYLAFVYNANIEQINIFRHIGHAILDTTEEIKAKYGNDISEYRKGISGQASSEEIEPHDYLFSCIAAGKKEFAKLQAEKSAHDAKNLGE